MRSLEDLIANHREGEITQINVVAWSRGAATAQLFANMLSEDPVLSKIDVRMVAIDPVAGPANHGANVMTIASNVKELIVYTARNERSYFFETFLPTNSKGRMDDATWVRPMAGNHAMLVGGHKKGSFDTGLAEAVGSGMRMRVADHLRQWGSVINETIPGAATTVPMMNAQRLDEIQTRIDRASEAGTFDVLHRSGYAGILTHLFDKVYATKDAFVRLPTRHEGDGLYQWADLKNSTVETWHPWLSSAAYRVAETVRSIVGALLPSQTTLSQHVTQLV